MTPLLPLPERVMEEEDEFELPDDDDGRPIRNLHTCIRVQEIYMYKKFRRLV